MVELAGPDFDAFLIAPQEEQPFIMDAAELMHQWDGVNYCLLVLAKDRTDGVLIDSEGGPCARYAAYLPQARALVNAKLEQAVDFIIQQGVRNTASGSWCVYCEELTEKFDLTIPEGSGLDSMLKDTLERRPEVAAVTMGSGAIETTFHPEFCTELQSHAVVAKPDIRLRDILPLLTGSALDDDIEDSCKLFFTHPETDARVWPEDLRVLTPTGQKDYAALLNARVTGIIPTDEGIKLALTDVEPEELVRFSDDYQRTPAGVRGAYRYALTYLHVPRQQLGTAQLCGAVRHVLPAPAGDAGAVPEYRKRPSVSGQ